MGSYSVFSRLLRGNFWAFNSIWKPAVNNYTGKLHPEKYISVWGINISLWVIELWTNKGSYFGPFSRLLRGNFCAKNSTLSPAINPTRRLHPKKYSSLGHKHLAPGNKVVKKDKKVPIRPFSRLLRGNFCA
jgi:hypothetical protein